MILLDQIDRNIFKHSFHFITDLEFFIEFILINIFSYDLRNITCDQNPPVAFTFNVKLFASLPGIQGKYPKRFCR
jgi:hypothetical protein